MKRTELRRKKPMPKGKPLRRIERLLPGGPTRRLKRKVAGLRAPGTPARPDQDTPKRTGRGWNSTLPASRKPLKQTRHRKAFRHLRDEPFKAWVRAQGCILRGKPGHTCKGPVEFAHLHNEGNGGADRGNGVGLCRDVGHRFGAKSHHVMGKVSFPAYWGVDLEGTARALATRYEQEAA